MGNSVQFSNNSLVFTLRDDEGVGDVGGVVDAEADAEHDVDAGDGVDGEAPEVDHSRDVHQGEEDARQDLAEEERALYVIPKYGPIYLKTILILTLNIIPFYISWHGRILKLRRQSIANK